MFKLLRKTGTGLWLQADGTLSAESSAAVQIRDVHHALQLCRTHRLNGMEIVLKFEKDEYDVALPVGDIN
jgi:hypothetical protein